MFAVYFYSAETPEWMTIVSIHLTYKGAIKECAKWCAEGLECCVIELEPELM